VTLASLLETHRSRIAADWATRARSRPGSGYANRPAAEIEEWAASALDAVIQSEGEGSARPLRERATRVAVRLEHAADGSATLAVLNPGTRRRMGPMKRDRITVLIVDDHTVVRRGLSALLGTEADIRVVGEAANGREAVAQAEALRPDVILMDLVMPVMDGVAATAQIMADRPDSHILVLTSFGSDVKLFPAVKAGAVGYLLKDTTPEELVKAIRRAA